VSKVEVSAWLEDVLQLVEREQVEEEHRGDNGL
jgi:hypothetical protein